MAEKEHDLTCSMCLEEFKDPKILPCCHMFCKGCLEHILEKSEQKENLICQQCRAEHHVPVVAFQKNHTGQAIPVGGPDAFLSESENTWLLEFTPCCGGRHAVSACVYGYWTSCHWSSHVPTFYVEGRLKKGDIVCQMLDWLPELLLKAKENAAEKETAADKEPVADKETGKVTHVEHSTSKAGNLTCQVQVKFIKGEELGMFSIG